MKSGDSLLIGVDGGGTACKVALCANGGADLTGVTEVRRGPANVSDFAGAVANILDGLDAVLAAAGLTRTALRRARLHLGLAGVMDGTIAARVAAAMPVAGAVVTDDQPTTIAGALGEAEGAVAAIGTGSFVGRQTGAGITSVGGWGLAIGDQASGAWLGRALLEKTMLALDGISAASDLTEATRREIGPGAAELVAFSITARPADFARLAPGIMAAAEAGDAVALRLVAAGARYITAALGALGWTPGSALCLTGGLGPSYLRWLPEEIAAAIVPAKGNALHGALMLAARQPERMS